MTNEVVKGTNKTERSSRFPSITLEYAVKVIAEARVFGREINDSHLAGKGVPKGGAFGRKKASLGYYGLLEGRGNSYRITDLAESIIFPSNETERIDALRKSFLFPELFHHLYDATQKNIPIDVDILGNVVVRNYKVSPNAKDEFLSNFIKSGIIAELVEYTDNKKAIILREKPGATENTGELFEEVLPTEKKQLQEIPPMYNAEPELEGQVLDIKLEKGKGKFILPNDISINDATKIKALIDVLVNG